MRNKMQQFGLILVGAVAGVMLSLNFSAVANKDTKKFCAHFQLRSYALLPRYSAVLRMTMLNR